jgi:hypothetical protein
MSERKIVLSEEKGKQVPLSVVRFRMPSENRKNLTLTEREAYHDAYFKAWRRLSALGFKDTTSTVLTRKTKEEIEFAIAKAIEEYQKRGLEVPNFTKTAIEKLEEEAWLRSAMEVIRTKVNELEEQLQELVPTDKKTELKIDRIRREVVKLKQIARELVGQDEELEEVLKGI